MDADMEMWDDFDVAMCHINVGKDESIKTEHHYMCVCGGARIHDPGKIPVCTSCGRVDNVYIDNAPEWTNGVSEGGVGTDNSRAGDLALDGDLYSAAWGTGTVIKAGWKSSYSMKRMSRINFYQSMNPKDRRLFHSYATIDKIASTKLELSSDVTKAAKVMYKKFSEGGVLTRGGNRQGIMANCIYYACKLTNNPRTIDEVANAYDIDRRFMSRMESSFLDVVKPQENETCASASLSHRLLNEFSDVNGRDRMKVNNMCIKVSNCSQLMSKHPKTIAATVIMIVLERPKSEVCKMTGVSSSTISKLENIVREYIA
jgi:transcription initiation factor TFIIIB Brf1 subunit/transcription initiation factor TFIIB